jgi:hypothetical protein
MQLRRTYFVALLFALLSTSFVIQGESASQQTSVVVGARIKGKALIVEGVSFAEGASVLINGEKQKTNNDLDLPSRILRAQ